MLFHLENIISGCPLAQVSPLLTARSHLPCTVPSYWESIWDTVRDFQGVHPFARVRANPQGGCWEEGVFFQTPSPIPASPASPGYRKFILPPIGSTAKQSSTDASSWGLKKPAHAVI